MKRVVFCILFISLSILVADARFIKLGVTSPVAAPINSVVPVISSSAPQTGTAETTTNGTWSNSPTSYNYQWERVDTSMNIGTNSNSYTPVTSDVTHTLGIAVQACNAGGCNTANSTATSSVAYYTTFPSTENPVSQGGIWTNGATNGLDWGNVQTTPGAIFGVSQPAQFADPSAALSGISFNPNQQASATVTLVSCSFCDGEVELRLRTTITAHSITGYEIDCDVNPSVPSRFVAIVKWEGALGSFTYINNSDTTDYCKNGDVLSATITGNPPTITVYLNGTQIVQGVDSSSPFNNGSPGVGFYGFGDNIWNEYTFSNFKASNF